MYDLKKHLAELGAANWSEWKASLANDVVYEEIATHTRAKGPEEYLKTVQRWKRAFPDMKATVLDTFASGEMIVAEVEWEGTHTGALDGPFGSIAPTGKRGLLKASMVARVRDDKLVELHHYFDMVTMLANLGIAPFAGVGAQPAKSAAVQANPSR